MKINIYDFDKTIYKNDSCVDFIKYTLKKHPFLMSFIIIKSIPSMIMYLFNKKYLKKMKENLLSIITKINDFENYIEKFWDKHEKNINSWYLNQKKETDIIISANFDFIINPICKRMKLQNIISTKIDLKTAKIIGNQCRKEEKVKVLKEKYPNILVGETYSDSKNDIPLLEIGNPGYVVKGEKLEKYYKGYFK